MKRATQVVTVGAALLLSMDLVVLAIEGGTVGPMMTDGVGFWSHREAFVPPATMAILAVLSLLFVGAAFALRSQISARMRALLVFEAAMVCVTAAYAVWVQRLLTAR